MGLSYTQYVAELLALSKFNASDPLFTTNLPNAIDYAYDRINRELNLLSTVASNSSLTLTAGSRLLDYSAANINVLQDINIISPATATNPEEGTRNPCTIADKSFLNAVYNSPSQVGVPVSFAPFDDHTLLFGPFPDADYTVELIGTVKIVPLSAAAPTNWISENLPDLLLTASMIQVSGFKMNYGAMTEDPKQAISYESQYLSLRDSAAVEDARRKFQATGYTSELPTQFNQART